MNATPPVGPIDPHSATPSISVAVTTSGSPPSKIARAPSKPYKPEYTPKEDLLVSLFLLPFRAAVGAGFLASTLIKVIIGTAALAGGAAAKNTEAQAFGLAALRDSRRDLANGLLLVFTAALSPIGSLWTVWDISENRMPTHFADGNLGSLGKEYFYRLGAKIQDKIDPYRSFTHLTTARSVDRDFVNFAKIITCFNETIHKPLNRGRITDLRLPRSIGLIPLPKDEEMKTREKE